MSRPTVVHLVDDTTPGGVMRVIDHIVTHPAMMRAADHQVLPVRRGRLTPPRISAAMIVSHLAISWRALPMLMQLRAMQAHVPVLHVEHSYTAGFVAQNVDKPQRFFTLLRTAYALFDHVAAVSAAQWHWLAMRGLVEPGRLSLLRSAVDVTPFLKLPPVRHAPAVVGAMGRLDGQKGFDILIRAFRACDRPDLRLEVFGDGPERAALAALARGDARITFHGRYHDPVAAMAAVDVVAMPSRWEAYGLVGLEARAAGRGLWVSGADGLADHARGGATRVGQGVEAWRSALAGLGPASLSGVAESRLRAMHLPDDSTAAWQALLRRMDVDGTPAEAAGDARRGTSATRAPGAALAWPASRTPLRPGTAGAGQ